MPDRPTTFREGDLVCDRFRVVRFIARGGMGEVYEAQDLELGERVALKTIRPEIAADERINQRFRREVQLARKITHANICRIFDLFQHQDPRLGSGVPPIVFVTMELLVGETLSQHLKRRGAMREDEARPIVVQMAAALAAAHQADVVHRDFKTSNVVLLPAARAGDPPRVVVTDFGLAYSVGDATRGASLSAAGEVVGTPDYMAPEQIEGGEITPATDVYALGLVMYEMVTGVRPFAAETPIAAALRRVSGSPPKPPREHAPGLPAAWDVAIMRCLARLPERRFPDAGFVLETLEAGASGSARRSRSGSPPAMRLAAAAALVAIGAGITWWIWSGRAAPAMAPAGTAAGAGAVPPGAGVASRPAVAVLGFRNLAGRDDVQWLSTAFAEMLRTELGASDALRTIPGETVDRMKIELALADADVYEPETLLRIRENLGSDLVLFGSYATVGTGDGAVLRVDIRLQDSRAGQTVSLVSESGRASELFDVVARAGAQLRRRIGVDAVPDAVNLARAAQPRTPEATRYYSEGLAGLRRFDALGARALFERAIQADPTFPLAHAALARTWSALGYDDRARAAAARAFELASGLPRADRLQVEGTYRELAAAWPEAIEIWRTLATFFPDDVEHALRLANAQIASGAPRDGLATIERFRRTFPGVADPRLALAEAAAADTLSDFKRMEDAAAAAALGGARQGATLLVANARLREGTALVRQSRTAESVPLMEEARRLYEAAGDRAGVARALNNLAAAISDGPDTRRTVALYEEGLAIARAVGDQNLVARFLNNLAIQERRAGNLQASLQMNRQALAIRREIGDRTNAAVSLNNIGNVLLDMGDLSGASDHYEQSATLSREIGDRRGLARALHNASEALRLQLQLARAKATSSEALEIRRGIDDPASVATSIVGLASIMAVQGDLAPAARLLNEALAAEERLQRPRAVAYVHYHLGDVALAQGDAARARRHHQQALELRTELGEKGTSAESRLALAILSLEEGQASAAEGLLREAIPVFEAQQAGDSEGLSRATLAMALAAQSRPADAAREAARARALVRGTQNGMLRLPTLVAAARADAAAAPDRARRELEGVRQEAATLGVPRFELEARRAIADVEQRLAPASADATRAALRKDAAARGFGLYTR